MMFATLIWINMDPIFFTKSSSNIVVSFPVSRVFAATTVYKFYPRDFISFVLHFAIINITFVHRTISACVANIFCCIYNFCYCFQFNLTLWLSSFFFVEAHMSTRWTNLSVIFSNDRTIESIAARTVTIA